MKKKVSSKKPAAKPAAKNSDRSKKESLTKTATSSAKKATPAKASKAPAKTEAKISKSVPVKAEKASPTKVSKAPQIVNKTPSKVIPKKVVAEIVDPNEAPRHEPELDDDIEFLDEEPQNLLPAKASSKALAPTDPVALYLQELRKYPLLTKEQEQEIAKKYYETKDPVAAQALVTANLRFVVKVAAEYSRFGARMIDLIQEGNMGLMHAVKDFNPYKGVRLITYAVWWIRGYIQEYLMKQYSLVKIGTTQNQKKLFYKLQKEREALEKMGEESSVKLIAEKMGIPEDEVRMMTQRMSGRDVSLNAPLDSDSPSSLLDMQKTSDITPDEELSHREELSHLDEVIKELRPLLSEREKIILDERILNDEPLTLQEIGEKHNITREAVRQMEVRVMKKIKEKMGVTETEE